MWSLVHAKPFFLTPPNSQYNRDNYQILIYSFKGDTLWHTS